MTAHQPFPRQELDRRLDTLRDTMAERDLDGILVASPENIYYLTGLDHWGFFATHVLVVPRDGGMRLVARAMERITITNQVANAAFHGHSDGEEPADHVLEVMSLLGIRDGRVALEERSLFLTPHTASRIKAGAPAAAMERRLGPHRYPADCQVAARSLLHAPCRRGGGCRHAGGHRRHSPWRQRS